METVEDAKWQSEALNQGPGHVAIKVQLHGIGQYFLCLEGVNEPHGNVADEQESDGLARRLAAFLLREMHAAAGHVGDEQQLEYHLKNT